MAKKCSKCLETKDFTMFHRSSKSSDGHRAVCKVCRKGQNYGNHPEYKRAWYENNKERILLERQEYYKVKSDIILNRVRNRYLKIKDTVKFKNTRKRHAAERRLYVKQRTPPWAKLSNIKQFYENCPNGYHVDHIIPLRGKFVSGLHVASNLQYLTPQENFSKNNKYEVNFV